MKSFFIYLILIIVINSFSLLIGLDYLYSNPSKFKEKKSDKKIEIFCSKIDPENIYCRKQAELKLKRLELKSLIYKDFEKFCQINRDNKYCMTKKIPSIFVLCTTILAYTNSCKDWQSLKQQELENKGFLYEEIATFCKKFPTHAFCK